LFKCKSYHLYKNKNEKLVEIDVDIMAMTTQEDEDVETHVLATGMENARILSNILQAIHFKDHAMIFASSHGLKVIVEEAKCMQGNAFLQASLFQPFQLSQDQVTFRVNLSVFLDCLNMFGKPEASGAPVGLRMFYHGYGHPLELMLEESGVVTDCRLKTMEPSDILDFDFNSTNVCSKIIMKAECLKVAFSELDMTSDLLEILISPEDPYFRLSTFGIAGSSTQDFPQDSDMIEAFYCQNLASHRYRMALIKPCIRALSVADKVSVRVDFRGFLSLQFLIKNEDGQISFVEFYCCPDEQTNPHA